MDKIKYLNQNYIETETINKEKVMEMDDTLNLSQSELNELINNIETTRKNLRKSDPNFSTFASLGKSRTIPVLGDTNGISILTANHFGLPDTGYKYLKKVLTTDNVSYYIKKELVLYVLLNRIPELKDMIGFEHKHPHHHLDVWEHTMLALNISPKDFDIRLVLLLHDIGKPHCFQEGEVRHFKGHAKVSSQMAFNILKRFEFDEDKINEICNLIELHDTPITEEDILNNRDLAIKRFKIQCCDALAHNPQKLEKRIAYLNSISELLNNEEEKMAYKTLKKKY